MRVLAGVAAVGARPQACFRLPESPDARCPSLFGITRITLGALSTARRADAAVRSWLEGCGIGHEGIVLENGSGLSRLEKIAPAQLASVLQAAAASRWAPEFLASLPIVAVDGGMRNRLRESPAASCARIKTGTLRDVTAVAGYVTDESRETYAVVAIINHPLAKRAAARPIVDALIRLGGALETRFHKRKRPTGGPVGRLSLSDAGR